VFACAAAMMAVSPGALSVPQAGCKAWAAAGECTKNAGRAGSWRAGRARHTETDSVLHRLMQDHTPTHGGKANVQCPSASPAAFARTCLRQPPPQRARELASQVPGSNPANSAGFMLDACPFSCPEGCPHPLDPPGPKATALVRCLSI
jgi:hypothetical protein